MSRIAYSDDEEFPGQFAMWQANCSRSLAGKQGQWALRELEAAIVALPTKRLISGAIACNGEVCAVGALIVALKTREGVARDEVLKSLERQPSEDEWDDELDEGETEDAAVQLGVPRLVAWSLVALNDIELDTVWEVAHGPIPPGFGSYQGGISVVRDMTPEERYERVLAFVRSKIKQAA